MVIMGELQQSEAREILLFKRDIFLNTSLVEERGGLDGGDGARPEQQDGHDG